MKNPYEDLYIYYIKGRLEQDKELFGKGFIGNWYEDGFSFLFYSKPAREKVSELLNERPYLTLLDEFEMTYDQWQGGKPAPFHLGRFMIVPPWLTSENKIHSHPDKFTVLLDSGVVFGTGTHPTTRDCLEAMDMAFSLRKIDSVLDLGTGTGLLALAACRLGCRHTLAVDLNFLAASTALNNVHLNGLEKMIVVVQGNAKDFIDSQVDFVVANIHYDVLKHLVISEGFLKNKLFVISGLLRSQAKDLIYRLSSLPVEILKKWESDGIWHTFLGRIC